MTTTPYPRPEITDDEQVKLARFVYEFFSRVPRKSQIIALSSIVAENVSLTREVNQHREARGFEPLPTYDPKI